MSVLKNLKKACIVYCRVSLASQKPDLENQIRAMSDFATARGYVFTVVSEVGGGMNMNRPKFMRLVNGIIDGSVGTIIVASKDRLMRFGFDLVDNLAKSYGAEIIVANREDMSSEQEMVEDLMTIVRTYSCRLYGLKRYRTSKDLIGGE